MGVCVCDFSFLQSAILKIPDKKNTLITLVNMLQPSIYVSGSWKFLHIYRERRS